MLKKALENNKGYALKLLKELVETDTSNPPGKNYRKIIGIIERECRKLGMKTKAVTIPKAELKKENLGIARANLIAELDAKKERWLHINSHFDVVPATNGWKTKPFELIEKGKRLYARGSYDMKSFIAAKLTALKLLKELNIKPGYNIQLSFVCDEETGGKLGFGYLLRKGLVKADYAIGEGYSKSLIGYGNKGILWVEIEVKGKPSHAAYSYKGTNAFEYAVMLAREMLKLKKAVEKRRTRHNTKGKKDSYASFVIGGLTKGCSKINTVPDSFSFSIDRRVLPEEDINEAEKEIKDAIKSFSEKHSCVKIKAKVLQKEKPVVSDISSSFCKSFLSIVKKRHKGARYALMAGMTDLRHLLYKGIPCISYSVDGKNMHSDNEFIEKKDFFDVVCILAAAIAGNSRLL